MHRPSRVGLLNLAEGDGARAVQSVLDDLAEAGAFYEMHSSVAEPVEFMTCEASGCEAFAAGEPGSCDAFVLGFYLNGSEEFDPFERLVAEALQGFSRGAMVYALCFSAAFTAGPALLGLERIEAACAESGHVWCGGMVVGCAGALPRLQGKPRMGMARRKVSEVTDELLLAIRCGACAGSIVARPGLFCCLREILHLA